MNITNPQYSTDDDGNNICVIVTIDGVKMAVPIDTNNRHYQAILEWIAEGNQIADAD